MNAKPLAAKRSLEIPLTPAEIRSLRKPQAGDAIAPPADAAKLAPIDDSANHVTICAWCPQLHILKLQRRDVDVVIIFQQNKELKIIRNGVQLTVSHGICAPCRARLR